MIELDEAEITKTIVIGWADTLRKLSKSESEVEALKKDVVRNSTESVQRGMRLDEHFRTVRDLIARINYALDPEDPYTVEKLKEYVAAISGVYLPLTREAEAAENEARRNKHD